MFRVSKPKMLSLLKVPIFYDRKKRCKFISCDTETLQQGKEVLESMKNFSSEKVRNIKANNYSTMLNVTS
jgi:hypothetical protein